MLRWMFLLVAGCANGTINIEPVDSAEPTDTGDVVEPDVEPDGFEVRFDGPVGASSRVGRYLAHFDDDGFVLVGEASSASVTSWPHYLQDTPPSADDLVDYGDGAGRAFWFVIAYQDADGSESLSPDEPIDAVAPRLLAYVDRFQGESDVWYAMSFGDDEPEYHLADDGFELFGLQNPDAITLSGETSWQGPPQGQPDRAATLTSTEFEATPLPGRPLDVVLESPFSLEFVGAPDVGRQVTEDGFTYGIEIPVGYRDVDGSGDYGAGDELNSLMCRGSDPVYLLWVPPRESLEDTLIAGLYQVATGWTAYATTAAGEEALADTTGLLLSNHSCAF